MTLCRVAVGEMDLELRPGTDAWTALAAALARVRPDLFVLNELPGRHPLRLGRGGRSS